MFLQLRGVKGRKHLREQEHLLEEKVTPKVQITKGKTGPETQKGKTERSGRVLKKPHPKICQRCKLVPRRTEYLAFNMKLVLI